jgi:WD repeat-containing protein 35
MKLLYLISKYSHCAQTVHEKERWIRKLPMLVLLYEGIISNVFEYDYAPASEVVETTRVYMNVTQEGKDDLDDLVEGKLVKGLRLSTKEHQSVTAYQISPSGLQLISKRLPDEERQLVDDLCVVDGKLLQVVWEEDKFLLRTMTFSRESSITDAEDVSYVVSPYLPRSLRRVGGPVMSSNAHRASESASKESTIRDDLDEVITLSNVTILIGEWIPFGANQVVELNLKLGSNERCQGGYFTAQVDDDSTNTQCEVPTGLTSVQILDHDMTRFTNLEAEVYYPEEDGVVQIEHFGIHTRMDGTVVYGLMIESVMDRILENISLDNLARLLVDVHVDSSRMMESLLSNHQRDLLDMIFLGNTGNRPKVNVIIADRVVPKQAAERYLDKDAFENEIRQVIGDTYEAHDLGENDVVITGSHGIMLVGPHSKMQEGVMLAFLSLRSRDVFVQNVFNRLFIIDDVLKTTRTSIATYEQDPNSVPKIRAVLSETSKDIILLEEVLLYLHESLEQDTSIYAEPVDEAGYKLYQVLKVKLILNDLQIRISDMQKVLKGSRHEVNGLRSMTDTIAETQMFRLQEEIRGNSSDMLHQLKVNERAATSMDMLQILFAGLLAFAILDRVTGEWTVVHTTWAREFIVEPFMNKPMLWFLISMVAWFLVGRTVFWAMAETLDKTGGVITFRVKVNKAIDLNALDAYLSRKAVTSEDGDADSLNANQKVSWVEKDAAKWEGYKPKIEMNYDLKFGFLLTVYLQVSRRASKPAKLRPETLKMRFFTELQEAGIMAPDDAAEVIDNTRRRQTRDDEMVSVEDATVFLKVRVPGERHYREIPFGRQSYLELREEIAHKFECKPVHVVQVFKEPDILIADDDDVSRLKPGTILEVNIKNYKGVEKKLIGEGPEDY